jgi:hypothetical protein
VTILTVYGSVVAICAASALIGQAVMSACGWRRWSWLSPAVGLSALLAVAGIAARVPGRATTGLIAILALTAASATWLRGRVEGLGEAARVGLPVATIVILLVSVPFAISGRLGILGTLVLADFAEQLFMGEWIRTELPPEPDKLALGYPVGPHGLATALSTGGLGPLAATLTALMLAVPVITALTALSRLGSLGGWRRLVAATLTGIPYLAIAYLLQSGFKETIFGLLLLAFALLLAEAGASSDPDRRWVPAGLLAAGAVYVFGLPGLVWLIAILACLALADGVARRELPRVPLRSSAVPVAVALLAVGPHVAGAGRFLGSDTAAGTVRPGSDYLGNLPEPLRVWEGLGVWPSPDYRLPPGGALAEPVCALVGIAAVVFGLAWWVRRRQLGPPAALVACLAVYATAVWLSSPFFEAKALAVLAPLAALISLGALLAPSASAGPRRLARLGLTARGFLAAAFVAGSAASSVIALQGAMVESTSQEAELASFRPLVKEHRVLFLARDIFAPYKLRGARVIGPGEGFREALVPFRPDKPGIGLFPYQFVRVEGDLIDFDSIQPHVLNRFDYAVTSRTDYESQAPEAFRRVRATRSFLLWKRSGQARPRSILFEEGVPGRTLDCRRSSRRLINTPRSVAAIFPVAPRIHAYQAWRPVAGSDPPASRQRLELPPGKWELSLQYHSQVPLDVEAAGIHRTLPSNTGIMGPFWPIGSIQTGGRPFEIRVSRGNRSFLAGLVGRRLGRKTPEWLLGELAAVRRQPRKLVGLRAACGRYVDWYRLGPGRS